MKYLFILGRNPELSIAELKSFFRKNEIEFKNIDLKENGLLVETLSKLDRGIVKKLGGTISFGEVISEGEIKDLFSKLEKLELHRVKGNKLNYVVYNFDEENYEDVANYLKSRFKEEKFKATEKKLSGKIKMQEGKEIPNVASNLLDEQYFIFSASGISYFGRVIETSDYKAIEKRDMEKPVRRNELAISPRLAKILINLSEVKENQILLDPFCGIGVILEEALLQRIKIVGVDKDKEAIEGAKKNLNFFGFRREDYRLINDDSSRAKTGKVAGIATEPDLGKLHKKTPTEKEAKEIIDRFERLMIGILRNLKNNVQGKIVFTSPLVLSGNKGSRIGCDFNKIASSAGLNVCEGPIEEFREGFSSKSIVGRSIVVMEK